MNNASIKLLAVVLFSAISIGLLRAQTNEADSNIAPATAKSAFTSTNALPISNSIPVPKSAHKFLYDSQPGHVVPRPLYPPYANFKPGNQNYVISSLGPEKTLVALAGIVCPLTFFFALPVTIILIVYRFRHRQNKMIHETVRAMLEKGIPVTPELIAGLNPRGFSVNIQGKLDRAKTQNRHLLPGLIFAAAGLALIVTLPEHSFPAGLIILFIGLAFLIVWLVERKQRRDEEHQSNIQPAERKQDNDQQSPKM